MQKARIVVRAQIHGIKDDLGLEALNGIYKSPFEDFEDSAHAYEIVCALRDKYKKEYNNIDYSTITVEYEN